MRKTQGYVIKVLLLMMILSLVGGSVTGAEEYSKGQRERELSENGAVHQQRYDEILNNLDKYAYVEDFKLTRYIPRDSSKPDWVDTTKGVTGSNVKSVHWYQEGGKWIFSSASAERFERTKDRFTDRKFTEVKLYYNDDQRKLIQQLVFEDDVSKTDRTISMPGPGCNAAIQYAGDPFTGAHGFVDWGSVAADVAHNGIFKKDTKLFIEGYGKGDVHDVGGGVRGRHLDLFMDNCEEGLDGGLTNGATVIYEKGKSGITDGRPVTKEILDKVMGGKKWGDGGSGGGNQEGTGTAGGTGGTGGDGEYRNGKWESFDPFRDHKISTTVVGVDRSESSVPGELSYVMTSKAEGTYKLLQKGMFIFGAGLLMFVAMQMASIVIMTRGSAGYMNQKVETALFGQVEAGASTPYYAKIVAVNTLLLMIVLTLVLGSYYVVIQGKIYAGIAYALSFVM